MNSDDSVSLNLIYFCIPLEEAQNNSPEMSSIHDILLSYAYL